MTTSTDLGPADANKKLFLDAFARFAAGDADVLRTVLHEDFVEHSPGNPSGRDAWVDFVAASPVAGARLDLRRVIADADHVVAHYRMVEPGGGRGTAVVDIWRFVDGLITEHWDVVQPVPDDAEVPHGMF
jgi:predicted SnoaL-like aldol condensation-catalyzing enzyme